MTVKTTPMMAQWHACKHAAKDALLLFRMGDFYESFYDDAVTLARELELTLTKRQEIPMAGIPWHSAEGYIDRLVAKGIRVAIAEQTEDPKKTKGLVKREVVRVVTPGTTTQVADKRNNYFVAIAQQGAMIGLAALDLTTADFQVSEFENEEALLNELYRLSPSEFLVSEKVKAPLPEGALLNRREEWHFDHAMAYALLVDHFRIQSLDGFGLKGMVAAVKAAGALLAYLRNELHLNVDHVQRLLPVSLEHTMSLDRITQSNLELDTSFFRCMDRTQTAMGGRLLRHWVRQPLLDPRAICDRHDAVEELIQKRPSLSHMRDLERLTMKVCSGYATPRDLVALRTSLEQLPALKTTRFNAPLLRQQTDDLDPLTDVAETIARTLVDEPPAKLADGGIIRDGFHTDLDSLRSLGRDSKSWLADYQTNLRERLEIKTLKVGFNRVFGYYLEVSRGQSDRMPDTFQRRQTLANAERFVSPELKEYEEKVLGAEEKISTIENELYSALRAEVARHAQRILKTARAIAILDCLGSLAEIAKESRYTRPTVDASDRLSIFEGRHPVIEAAQIGQRFIANDTELNASTHRLGLITGPNMAGKSTYIRQVALITLMAQMGSFVPAASAHIGVVDKIFTRIGASDDLARGQSTFMVEMNETANILHNATSRSLVILDEIGRGTSTYDGVSIAWAVAEHLLTQTKARTLFATHYFELTQLEEKIPGAFNLNVSVHEADDEVVFLHKIVPGSADRSYGIHVARLAGLPLSVIGRAREILSHLESTGQALPKRRKKESHQLTLF